MSHFTRRELLGGAIATAIGSGPLASTVAMGGERRMPVGYLSHGSPRLPIDPVRSGALRAWGETLPKPKGIVVMTPHFASRTLELGPTHRGFAWYDMPSAMKRLLPQDLDYPSPPSGALAKRVEELVARGEPIERKERPGFDHTTWMPLLYVYPPADVPVVELGYPYRTDAELLAFGRRLAPLRDEGIFFLASGQLTHNLATIRLDDASPPPAWSKEFDAWARETLEKRDVDALVDWRKRAPAADLAHPDDGGHFRVLLVALGVALGSGGSFTASFPVEGYESSMSRRSVELG